MMPSYNAEHTLPTALASLIVQTHQNWECIIVDDGSKDRTADVVSKIKKKDQRIHSIHLDENQGRGMARQIALENSTGKFLAMLDADDWIYPDKLENQLKIFNRMPKAVLVSTAMAITDNTQNIIAIRRRVSDDEKPVLAPPIGFGAIPVDFAPSMIRLDVAKSIGFDNRLRRAEDANFLLELLLKNYYNISPKITYVYNEFGSTNYRNIKESIENFQLSLKKFRHLFPVKYKYWAVRLSLKLILYKFAFSLGIIDWVINHRYSKPASQDIQKYIFAKKRVLDAKKTLFDQ